MLRFGLCCIFKKEPIKFRRTTASYLQTMNRTEQLRYLAEICEHNAKSLLNALKFCHTHSIGCFRVNSQILPLKTHPDIGYDIQQLPNYKSIVDLFTQAGKFCRTYDIRTTFHPDQFILLTSPKNSVVQNAINDLMYHAQVAEWIGADVINIHGGGGYKDKVGTLKRLIEIVDHLPDPVRSRLTLENDDRVFTPKDLFPICKHIGIPMVYDIHHHRFLSDGLSIEQATDMSIQTWNREPLFHISSPINGWNRPNSNHHHEFIDPKDFPSYWLSIQSNVTIEIEAKAKEIAVLKLMKDLNRTTTHRSD